MSFTWSDSPGGFAVISRPVRVEGGWRLGRGLLESLLVRVRGNWMLSQWGQEKKIMASSHCDKHGRRRCHLLPLDTVSYLLPRSSCRSSSFLTGRWDSRNQFFWMSCPLCRRNFPSLIYLILKSIQGMFLGYQYLNQMASYFWGVCMQFYRLKFSVNTRSSKGNRYCDLELWKSRHKFS